MADTRPTPRARIDGLDGLRAFAVVGVLLYHADVPWAKGGFLGVDVFFVLSGYLVTSIVVEGFAKTGELGFRRFWGSRLRRLAPAQVTLLAAVTVCVALLHANELADLRGQVVAALTGTTNWYLLATQGSYFQQLGRPPVFRHLWSLAVELQFYLAWPPVLVFALKRGRDRIDRILLGLGVAILASTIYLALLFHPGSDPSRAYYDTFARLGAPLVGAALALVWRPRSLRRGPVSAQGNRVAAIGAVAFVGLLWMMHAVDDRSAFVYRGGFLLTALLSALVVAAVVHPGSPLGRREALAQPALVAIGLRSYGLYLWHWPVYDLIRPKIDVGWSWGLTFVVRILITVVLTEACYRLVERPWHTRAPSVSWSGIRARLLQPGAAPARLRLLSIGAVLLLVASVGILAVPHKKDDKIADSLRAGEQALVSQSTPGSTRPLPPVTTTSTTVPGQTTLPGTTTTAVPVDIGRVTLVGDSVMLGSAPDILDAFGGRANVDAKVARQAAELPPVIHQLGIEGRLGDTVVVQVGINGTVTEKNLDDIAQAADGRRLLIINCRVPRSWEQGNNETIQEVVPKLPRASIVNWYQVSDGHRAWFLNDGVHLNAEGRQAYAGLLLEAVRRAVAKG